MNVLDLFSGIGGFSLGLERAGMRTVAFVEKDEYCQRVLRKHWPDVPIFDDVKELASNDIAEPIDLICGGFPCQPWSVAGKRRGTEDDRDLWPEMFRVITEIRPAWVIGENVAGLVSMGLDRVLTDLADAGYASQTFDIPAVAVDAPHRRHRIWIVAHARHSESPGRGKASANNEGCSGAGIQARGESSPPRLSLADSERPERRPQHRPRDDQGEHGLPRGQEGSIRSGSRSTALADAEGQPVGAGLREDEQAGQRRGRSGTGGGEAIGWLPEPDVGRVAHGIPKRVDRLRALGNAVVPQVVEMIGRAIMAES